MAVVQAVFIFGSKTWVLTPHFEKSLEGFHHLALQRMSGMGPKFQQYGTWVYTPIRVVLATVGLEDIGVSIVGSNTLRISGSEIRTDEVQTLQ